MPAPGPSESQSPAGPENSSAAGDKFTRLHITPLDASLIEVVVPASVRPRARNVSFHTVETFPESRYGFVDLPSVDAEKLKAKLNGSVLRGIKMRIENARPEVREEPVGVTDELTKKSRKQKDGTKKDKSSKKRKRGDEVEDGVVLSDRKVKRGWTEVADYKSKSKDRKKDKSTKEGKDKDQKTKRIKSKYTEQPECLLKVRLPSAATKNLPDDDAAARKKRKKKGKEREVTVHEFENTTRFPTFLKDAGSKDEGSRRSAAEFVEGKGWVDEDGNVVEARTSQRPRPSITSTKATQKKKAIAEDSDDTTSSSGSSSDEEEDGDEEEEVETPKTLPMIKVAPAEESETSSEGSEDEDEDMEDSAEKTTTPAAALVQPGRSRPDSSGSSKNLTIKIPPNTPSPSSKDVHPLEALYKRKKPEDGEPATPTQKQEAFSFFGADAEDEDGQDGSDVRDGSDRNGSTPVPMTPFSRQDFEWRNVRSAAPTPDTAHPSRVQSLWSMDQDEEDEDMEEAAQSVEDANEDEDGHDSTKEAPQSSSDFQSWFWENRRDLNQSWMKRRKAAAKEKRHRENKARASKAV